MYLLIARKASINDPVFEDGCPPIYRYGNWSLTCWNVLFSTDLDLNVFIPFFIIPVNWRLVSFTSENFFRRAEQKCCGYWIRVTRNARNCNARSVKVGSNHCYVDRRPLHNIDEIVYEYDRKQFHRLVYVALSRVIFNTLFNISLCMCVDHDTYYKLYF